MSASPGGHQRIYRSLLRLYPADYRQAYGEQMVQLFGDQLRESGMARAWLRAPIDLVTTAASEHLRRNRTVAHSLTLPPTPLSRVLGLFGVIGGAVLLAGFLGLAFTPDMFNLRLVLFNIGAIAVAVAGYQRVAHSHGALALSAAIPVVVSNAVYMVLVITSVMRPGEIGPGDYQPVVAWFWAALAMWLSDAWFGLVTLRLGVLSRWSALALVIGSILALVGMSEFALLRSGTLIETLVLGGVALHGLAWVLLGLEIAVRRRPAPTASA